MGTFANYVSSTFEGGRDFFHAVLMVYALIFWTPAREGPIRSLVSVCMYVCMSVCMSVTKINFVNFLIIGSYDFFWTPEGKGPIR